MIPAKDNSEIKIFKNSATGGFFYTVENEDWSASTYASEVRKGDGTLLFAFTVTATYDGNETNITLSASKTDYENIVEGIYPFDLKRDGVVIVYGNVHIVDGTTQ